MEISCILSFAGHMIDQPNRLPPRFPPWVESAVRSEIRKAITSLSPVAAVSSAACGGDIIFAEEVLKQRIPLYVVLPFQDREDFIRRSVRFAGEGWVKRFRKVCDQAALSPFFVKPGGYRNDRDFADCQRAVVFFGLGFAAAINMQFVGLLLYDDTQPSDDVGGTQSFLELCDNLRLLYETIDLHATLNDLHQDRGTIEGEEK